MTGPDRGTSNPAGTAGSVAFFLAAVAVSLWVFAANGGLLTYFDSAYYIERGGQLVEMIGLADKAPPRPAATAESTGPAGTAEPAGAGGTAPGKAAAGAPKAGGGPESVDGSRSMVYSLVTGLFVWAGSVEGMALMNAVVAVGTILLAFSVVLRGLAVRPSAARVTFWAVLLASLGSLPFYVAFLMPDIYAPVLVLLAAMLASAAPRMRSAEIAATVALGGLAVTVHLSQLAMALVLLPAVTLAALVAGGRRRWIAPVAMLAIVGAGLAEQGLLRVAAREAMDAEVTYRPFLTARMIQDGPGLTYLADRCPDAAEPTCALYEALQRSDDPERLTATNISFATDPATGSFRLLPQSDQIRVAQGQFGFFLRVVLDRPFESAGAFARNVLRQLALNSVVMTLQTDAIVAQVEGSPGFAFTGSGHGRLTRWTGWVRAADIVQNTLYALSAAVGVALLASRRLPRPVALFVGFVLLGVVVNALVCGGLSQPAARYGSRVAWLLPVVALFGLSVLRTARAGAR